MSRSIISDIFYVVTMLWLVLTVLTQNQDRMVVCVRVCIVCMYCLRLDVSRCIYINMCLHICVCAIWLFVLCLCDCECMSALCNDRSWRYDVKCLSLVLNFSVDGCFFFFFFHTYTYMYMVRLVFAINIRFLLCVCVCV